MSKERAKDYCRSCGSEKINCFLPLGKHGPAQGFLREDQLQDETLFDLDTHACLDCGLVQVPNRIPPDFFRHYLWVPSTATQMHAHFRGLAELIQQRLLEDESELFVDIGCNDGCLLDIFKKDGAFTIGVEPTNASKDAEKKSKKIFNKLI